MRKTLLSFVALLALGGAALAGPVADFEMAMRDAYGNYRMALFATNSGKAEETGKAISAFTRKWSAITQSWGETPPPQYADDPQWAATVAAVTDTAAMAAAQAKSGKLAEAHGTLEAIRDALSDLHLRNGIISFSDRMNAYHAVMEQVLSSGVPKADQALLDQAHEHAAVLSHLANDMLQHPPADAMGSEQFETLAGVFKGSVAAYLDAARSRDPAKIKAAMGGLKPAYSKFFLKFG